MIKQNNNDLLNASKEYFKEGHYKIVEPMINELLVTDKFNPEVHYMAGSFYLEKGQLKKAMNSFKKSLEIDPGFTNASIGLSIILNDLGRYEEGKEVFEKAHTLMKQKKSSNSKANEDLAKKHGELGDLYFLQGKYREAIQNYNKASELSKHDLKFKLKVIDCLIKMNLLNHALKEAKKLKARYKQNWNIISKIIKIRNHMGLS